MEIKKVEIWSFTKIMTIFSFIVGIIGIIFLGIIQKLLQNVPLDALQGAGVTPLTLTLPIIFGTLISYTISGFIFGLLIALIYNILAKYIGGIKIELKESKKK